MNTAKNTQPEPLASARPQKKKISGWIIFVWSVFLLLIAGGLGLGGYYGYAEYKDIKNSIAYTEQEIAKIHSTRNVLRTEFNRLEEKRGVVQQQVDTRFDALETSLERLDPRNNRIQRLEAFIYLAERERIISRSPERVMHLLRQALVDLEASAEYFVLRDAIKKDLSVYESLVVRNRDSVFYDLLALSNQTGDLIFVAEFEKKESVSGSQGSGWKKWVQQLDRYVRIHTYDEEHERQLAFALDATTLKLVKLLLAGYLLEARNALLTENQEYYVGALKRYLSDLRHYYPPSASRSLLEKNASALIHASFRELPELQIVLLLPRYR